ncbi:hypothetical protein AAII07_56875 [Microvirga sp. 0TCS3.31]
MQDLGLIGVRDLSKLAKITAAESARPKVSKASSTGPSSRKMVARPEPAPSVAVAPVTAQAIDPQAALECTIKALEAVMAERLKSSIAQSEAGVIKAARAAIAEKARIDQRLVIRIRRVAEAEARRLAAARQAETEARMAAAEAKRQEAEVERQAGEAARLSQEQKAREESLRRKAHDTASAPVEKSKPLGKKASLSAVQGLSREAAPRPAPQSMAPAISKLIVLEAPAAARSVEVDGTETQVSGRGGWKSVRRDPARVMAQAKAKAKPANRADAVDLAQAAQAAIERFIAERGVTRTESGGIQSVVSRLQARGYIVVRDETGWMIDQRHRIDCESDLMAFAEARGITLSAAA